MNDHIFTAARRIIQHQLDSSDVYIVDLIDDIVTDPRIADADLDIKKYKQIIGAKEWNTLIAKHSHETQ